MQQFLFCLKTNGFRLLGLHLLCLCTSVSVYGNHAMAVDLNYACIADNTYEITLDFYYDCGSNILQTPPESPLIQVQSGTCGAFFSVNLDQIPNLSGEEVSQICETELLAGNSNCNGGILPGVERYVYKGLVLLPESCTDWVFSYRQEMGETRSATISNLESPELFPIYVEARLNNLLGCNNSPSFAASPVSYFCNQNSIYNSGVVETDGDSLVFSLVVPLENVNS
ncbi:MAG: hypothetical protein ACPGXL_06095, partial [Chitinophagales bacterium]